jgi:hypothetical protein
MKIYIPKLSFINNNKINIIFQIIIGFFLADFFTGLFHWFEDTYLDYCIDFPLIGEIAKDNELHHYFPRSIIAYSTFENIKLSILIIFIMIILLLLFKVHINLVIISFLFFATFVNVIHRYTHYRECETPVWFQTIQKTGLICSNAHHRSHHENVNEKYGVITEYNNYILDRIGFYRTLEYIIFIFSGISPNRKPNPDNYKEIYTYLHDNAKLKCPNKPTYDDVILLKKKLNEWKTCKNNYCYSQDTIS